MKRFLLLTLVAVMLFSTFILSSCDIFDNEEPEEQEKIRTTITADEWEKALLLTNYTAVIKDENGGSSSLIVAENMIIETIKDAPITEINVYDLKNQRLLVQTQLGWFAYNQQHGWLKIDFYKLGTQRYMPHGEVVFADLVYDEDNKCYMYKQQFMTYNFYFENGNLVYVYARHSRNKSVTEITNIGDTTLELPKYSIFDDYKIDSSDAPTSTVTTVTQTEFLNMWYNINNLTLNGVVHQSGRMLDVSFKLSKNGAELNAIVNGFSFTNYIVNIDGSYYALEQNDNKGYVISDKLEEISIKLGFSDLDISTLVYDEKNRCYSIDAGDGMYHFFFEDGELVKIERTLKDGVEYSYYRKMILFVSDVNQTDVNIPEYVIAE